MFRYIANLFGLKPKTPVAPTPYKIESPKVEVAKAESPAKTANPSKTKTARPKAEKKPAVKAKTARKPKAPKA